VTPKFLGTWQQSFLHHLSQLAVSQILEWDLSGTTLSVTDKIYNTDPFHGGE
jgi:hypothetical protein